MELSDVDWDYSCLLYTSAEIVEADDARAITIATVTNLIQRQDLSIMERGKAYKALLDVKNQQGHRSDLVIGTSGENRQKYSARALVAEFFGVTEYEIRKVIRLTQLMPELQDILENTPKQLNLACADLVADYDAESQAAFVEICSVCLLYTSGKENMGIEPQSMRNKLYRDTFTHAAITALKQQRKGNYTHGTGTVKTTAG